MTLSTEYPGDIPSTDDMEGLELVHHNRLIADVPLEFARLTTTGERLTIRDDDELIPGDKYTWRNSDTNYARNHLQGIQRLGETGLLVLSAGDAMDRVAQLLFVRTAAATRLGPMGTNVLFGDPPDTDQLIGMVLLDTEDYWHAGGMSLLDDILAIPLEASHLGTSKIVFLNVANPRDPVFFPRQIVRDTDVGIAGAVALTKLNSGYYLCAVWSDSDSDPTLPPRLDFYLSDGSDFSAGFSDDLVTWKQADLLPRTQGLIRFQSISFVMQADGRLYMIAMGNTNPDTTPVVSGRNCAELFHIDIPSLQGDSPSLGPVVITKLAERTFACGEYCDFAAAGGIHISETGLTLLSAYHWRIRRKIHLAEFRTEFPLKGERIDRMEQAWVELFEHSEYRGRRLTIHGDHNHAIGDYKKIFVRGDAFGDVVSSVRFQIPEGQTYRLYRDKNFETDDDPTTHLDLRGTSTVEELSDLHALDNFGDQVSSSRYISI